MEKQYDIVKPFDLYPIFDGIYIISSTPFLYVKKENTIIIGDLHFGHESALFNNKDTNKISKSSKNLIELILKVIERYNIKTVICNGDIKHTTNGIKIQEIEELKYFVSSVMSSNVEMQFIKGNHDTFLEFIFPHINLEKFEIFNSIIILNNILVFHGDDDEIVNKFDNYDLVILSHEHPAYTLRGMNRARIKLSAFVVVKAKNTPIIILPAANSISSGTNYPVYDKSKFLSPLLQKFARIETMEIFPFDDNMGIIELPPLKSWFKG